MSKLDDMKKVMEYLKHREPKAKAKDAEKAKAEKDAEKAKAKAEKVEKNIIKRKD